MRPLMMHCMPHAPRFPQRSISSAIAIARCLLHHVPRATAILPETDGDSAVAAEPDLPLAVHVHYLKVLLDWAVSQLVRQQRQQEERGGKQQPAGAAAAHPRLDPRVWDLLSALLSGDWAGPAVAASIPASILASAGLACQQAAASAAHGSREEEGAAVLASVDRCLRLLMGLPAAGQGRWSASCPATSFRPGVEPCVSLVAAVASAEPPGAAATSAARAPPGRLHSHWRHLMLTSVHALEAAVHGQPSSKKVYLATVPRLYAMLCALAFPDGPSEGDLALASSKSDGVRDATDLEKAARQEFPEKGAEALGTTILRLFETILFSEAHVQVGSS